MPEHVVFRSFENETLLLNLDTGQYHGVNPTGGSLIEAFDGAATVRDAIAAVAAEFDVQFQEIAPELLSFCGDLERRGLIVLRRAA